MFAEAKGDAMADVDIRDDEELRDEDQLGDEMAGEADESHTGAAVGGVGLLRSTWADAPPPMPEPAPTAEQGAEAPPPIPAAPPRRRSLNPLIRLGHILSGGPNQER